MEHREGITNINFKASRDIFLNNIRSSSIQNVITCQRSLADDDSWGELLQEIDEQLSTQWEPSEENDSSGEDHYSCFGSKVLVDSFTTKTNILNTTPKLDEITQIFERSQSVNSTPNKKPLRKSSLSHDSNFFQLGTLIEQQEQVQLFEYDQSQSQKQNKIRDIEFFEIISENIVYDYRTTVMIKNIPNKYTLQLLLDEINQHFKEKIDFFYLPVDGNNGCNVGYAFVNFLHQKDILQFYDMYNGSKWRRFNSEKICELRYARMQGKNALVNHFYFPPQQLSKIQMLVQTQKTKV